MKNLINILDRTAYKLETKGLIKEAEDLDVVSNTLENLPTNEIDDIVEKYTKTKAMGLCTAIDLKDCDLKIMQDKEEIRRYVLAMLKLIDMTPVGEMLIEKFGEDGLDGFSFSQFIMTSLMSGHFIDKTRNIYLDIFSCKAYDPKKVIEFSEMYFKGKVTDVRVYLRP